MSIDLSGSGLQFPEGDPQARLQGFATPLDECSCCVSWTCYVVCGGDSCYLPECVQCVTGCLVCVTSACKSCTI